MDRIHLESKQNTVLLFPYSQVWFKMFPTTWILVDSRINTGDHIGFRMIQFWVKYIERERNCMYSFIEVLLKKVTLICYSHVCFTCFLYVVIRFSLLLTHLITTLWLQDDPVLDQIHWESNQNKVLLFPTHMCGLTCFLHLGFRLTLVLIQLITLASR